jgi:ABC-type multidrug transport system fused ATPase/permease subunit
VLPYYLKALRLLWRRPWTSVLFLVTSVMHALGHALMALVASALALSLASRWGMQSGGMGAGWPAKLLRGGSAADAAFLFSFVGLAVVVMKAGAGAYATYIQTRIAAQVGCAVRLDLLDALLSRHRLRQPRQNDHGPDPAGSVLALTERVRDLEAGLAWGLLGGLRAVAQLLPLALLLVLLSARMAAVAAATLSAFGWLLGRARAGYREATSRAAREQAKLLEAADECVRHADLWVTYGAQSKARAGMQVLGRRLAEGSARLAAKAVLLSGTNEVLGAAALVVALAAQRGGALGSGLDGSTLLAFSVPFFLAYRPLRELSDARLAIVRAQAAYDDLGHVVGFGVERHIARPQSGLESGAEVPEETANRRIWPLGVLELRSLLLPLGACGPVTMRIEPGAVVVIVGPTAVGKTTLLRTLLGLERAAGGEILFDGVALADAPAGPNARPFAWVPQDAPLLADTLAHNVSLGNDDADSLEALEPFGAAHLVEALRGARLGAGGRGVSGGERQWIAIARAIATRQPVVVLDEPTSGLDPAAQRAVLEAIAALRGRRTVILVTHRSEPAAIADMVVRLEPKRAALRDRPAA